MQTVKLILTLVFLISIILPSSGQNLAKGKKYTFSEKPNYRLTEGSDNIDLTDGVKNLETRFWTNRSTVGWDNKHEVRITLDLGEIFSIEGFLINTARGATSGVMFPMDCHVFTSLDNDLFEYHGDLMLTGDYSTGDYKVDSFSLANIRSNGRYVVFVININGKFLFLDEIEVFGKKSNSQRRNNKKLIDRSVFETFLEQKRHESVMERQRKSHIESANEYLGNSIATDITHSQLDVERIIKNLQSEVLPAKVLFTPIESVEDLQRFSLNDAIRNQAEATGRYTIDKELSYFSLINNESTEQTITFEQDKGLNCAIYEILPVVSQNRTNVKDALSVVGNGPIKLKSGESRYFLLKSITNNDGNINIRNNENVDIAHLKIFYKSPENSSKKRLNVNLWAYLDRPVIKDNVGYVINDLNNAGVNVIVVHSSFIDGYRTKDFSKLKKYISYFNDLDEKKIFLFYNFKSDPHKKFQGKTFMDHTWKYNFKNWYERMLKELASIGVNTSEVYFYPYDEIKPDEVAKFNNLAKWGKSSIPNFKTFVTISDELSFAAANYSNIVQLSRKYLKNHRQINNSNIWIYDILNQSRDRDPYKDYRLLPWHVYYYELEGIGLWNYSSISSKQDAYYWKVGNGNQDYSLVYLDKDGQVLPSLRWFCLQQGIDDYQKLKNYEHILGKQKVKEIVRGVVENPDNTHRADAGLKELFQLL